MNARARLKELRSAGCKIYFSREVLAITDGERSVMVLGGEPEDLLEKWESSAEPVRYRQTLLELG